MKAEDYTAPAAISKRTVKEALIDYSPKIMVAVLWPRETS